MKDFKLKNSFFVCVMVLLIAILVGISLISVNQINADESDELILFEKSSELENVITVKNVLNFVEKCKKNGMDTQAICDLVYKALNYSDNEIPVFNQTEIDSIMTSTSISRQEVYFEVSSEGETEVVSENQALSAVNAWDEEGRNPDVGNKGWLSCELMVYSSQQYDSGNRRYNKENKIRVADHYGYILCSTWTWLKVPSSRLEDQHFVTWDNSIVEVAPEYYNSTKLVELNNKYKNQNKPDIAGFISDVKLLDAYNYVVNYNKNDVPTYASIYKGEPIDMDKAVFGVNLPTIFDSWNRTEVHSRIILRSKKNCIEDFFIDAGYAHKWTGFSGSISFSGSGGSLSINPTTNLDAFNVNARKAHVGPEEGWTYQ